MSHDFRDQEISALVVDPAPYIRALIREFLKVAGLSPVLESPDTSDALQKLHARPVDMVFCELATEPLDGLEFTRMLRQADDSPNPYIPVIMVTGHTEMANVTAARNAGVTEFLGKPFTPKGLYSRVKAVIWRPRPFVRTKTFFGPDRRRRWEQDYQGEERRRMTPAEADPAMWSDAV